MNLDKSYSIAIFCIIVTEFCERFSFCGLRTILSLYLRNELQFSENASTVIYHVFIMGCYFVPVAGAVCADSVFGRYRTILYFSLIYLVGNVLMLVGAISCIETSTLAFSAVGLILVSVGTGGVKPCMAIFGGDQFHLPEQHDLLQNFFSIFYFTINLGGFVGMIVTPILRKHVTCFGDDTCYPLGFGFPAALMLLSLLVFVMGKRWYRMKKPKEEVIVKFLKCVWYALRNQSKRKKNQHWLDSAKDKYDNKQIHDVKVVCAVLLLYVPLPIFWSLFDQQGSRWTFQASHMDGNVLGTQIVPDQMQVVNPAMVLLVIPIFDRIVYPFFKRLNFLENSLHRMAIGGLFAGCAFLLAGTLELILETTYPELPDQCHSSLNVINTLPCNVVVYNPFNKLESVQLGEMHMFKEILCHNYTNYNLVVEAPLECGTNSFMQQQFSLKATALESQIDSVLIGINPSNRIEAYMTDPVDFRKSLSGKPRLKVAYIKTSSDLTNVTVSMITAGFRDIYFVDNLTKSHLASSAYMEVPQGLYDCIVESKEIPKLHEQSFNLEFGAVYSLVIREQKMKIEFIKLYTMSKPNTVNIMWMLPQYFLISVAEILFGVAGLEFSFTQAPKSMRTVTVAGWYLTVAFGNLLVIVITQANLFKSQAYQFFLFAVLMVADMMVFVEMASNYRFVQLEADSMASFEGHQLLEKKSESGM